MRWRRTKNTAQKRDEVHGDNVFPNLIRALCLSALVVSLIWLITKH